MVSLEKVNQLIDELYPKYVDFWVKLCNIESPTTFKQGVDEVGKTIIDFTKDLGYEQEIVEFKECGNLVFLTYKSKNAIKPPVCLTAHMDTVFPVGTIKDHPSRIEGDMLHALGAADCKGGITSCLMSLEVLSKLGCLDKDITLLFNSEEEKSAALSGGKSINTICERAKGSICCLNTEMQRINIKNGLCLERKGSNTVIVKVKGVSAHSGLCNVKGANAILEASKKIAELEKLKDGDGITINCGFISGGTTPTNVPDYCEFHLNVRFFTPEQREEALKYVDKIVNTTYVQGTSATYEITGNRMPMPHSEKNYALLDRINQIYDSYGMQTYSPYKTWGASDSGELTCAGVPTIDCFGVLGFDLHNPLEHASLSSLKKSVRNVVIATANL